MITDFRPRTGIGQICFVVVESNRNYPPYRKIVDFSSNWIYIVERHKLREASRPSLDLLYTLAPVDLLRDSSGE